MKTKLDVQDKGDGEFWIPLMDFCTYYSDIDLCNFTPDIDEDGIEDNLGKWFYRIKR